MRDLYLVSAVLGGWIRFQTGRRTARGQQVFHNVAAGRDITLFQVGLAEFICDHITSRQECVRLNLPLIGFEAFKEDKHGDR